MIISCIHHSKAILTTRGPTSPHQDPKDPPAQPPLHTHPFLHKFYSAETFQVCFLWLLVAPLLCVFN